MLRTKRKRDFSRQGPLAGFCEYCNDALAPTKCEVLDEFTDYCIQ